MANRPLDLDITVISASGLDNFLFFFKVRVYAVVSLLHGTSVIERKTHSSYGRNPKWDHRIKFSVDESAVQSGTLLFVLRQHRLFGDKEIGEVSIPVRELIESDSGPMTKEQVVDYQVKSMRGKAKGTLTFSHQLKGRVVPHPDGTITSGSAHPTGPGYMMNQAPNHPQPPYSPSPYYPGGGWYQPSAPGGYPYPPQQAGY